MEDMGYFSRFICTDWIQGQLPMSGEENVLYLLVWQTHFSQETLLLGKKGRSQSTFQMSYFSMAFISK